MVRPPLEVADVIRAAGQSFIERNRSWLNRLHLKILTAIERCRTAALGSRRSVHALRLPRHLVQFVSQPALPSVSGERARALD